MVGRLADEVPFGWRAETADLYAEHIARVLAVPAHADEGSRHPYRSFKYGGAGRDPFALPGASPRRGTTGATAAPGTPDAATSPRADRP